MNIQQLYKSFGSAGKVGFNLGLLMFVYMHSRGYSDQAAWEVAGAAVMLAGWAHVIPSTVDQQNALTASPKAVSTLEPSIPHAVEQPTLQAPATPLAKTS